MTDIRFYHLERQSVHQALPVLLNKAREKYDRIVVQVASKKAMKPLSDALWSYHPSSFLAHGLAGKEFEAEQPILITDDAAANGNDATMCVLLDEAEREDLSAFDLVCVMFDGHNPESVSHARQQWKALKDGESDLTYWQQGDKGWEKKA